MPSSEDRFYLLEMRNRPVLYGDIGSLIRIEGLVIGGGGAQAILMLPGLKVNADIDTNPVLNGNTPEMSLEDWSDFIRRSDNPEILVGPSPNGMNATLPKIWHRKLRYEVSGAVQQKVWAADGFACKYCNAPMGKALLTIDHFIPLESGGVNDVTNYLTACKPCNKKKGGQMPQDFLRPEKYDTLRLYLANRKVA